MKSVVLVLGAVLAVVVLTEAQPVIIVPVSEYENHLRFRRSVKDLLEDSSSRVQRQAGGDHHDVVDFGAHTGHHGAFGWYADFPVHSHD